jgi:CubicO group peptidase (beta-lactamase class C family)
MRLVDAGRLRLDELVEGSFGEWRGGDRERVSVRDLLEHASGLAARLVDPTGGNRREFEHEICRMPLEYAPRSRSVYSDLGFILLAFLAADRDERSLADQYANATSDPVFGSASDRLMFDVPPEARARTAPTTPADNDLRRGRRLVGEVHDNYAASLGGIAGHAGLFGTSAAVGSFARVVLRAARGDRSMPPPFTVDRVREFVTRSSVPDSSRALGWDTMLPTSSCGTRMSARAIGHVGFTGTSLWIDPARDRYFVLLSNRAHQGGSLDQMRDVRRAFHDALAEV